MTRATSISPSKKRIVLIFVLAMIIGLFMGQKLYAARKPILLIGDSRLFGMCKQFGIQEDCHVLAQCLGGQSRDFQDLRTWTWYSGNTNRINTLTGTTTESFDLLKAIKKNKIKRIIYMLGALEPDYPFNDLAAIECLQERTNCKMFVTGLVPVTSKYHQLSVYGTPVDWNYVNECMENWGEVIKENANVTFIDLFSLWQKNKKSLKKTTDGLHYDDYTTSYQALLPYLGRKEKKQAPKKTVGKCYTINPNSPILSSYSNSSNLNQYTKDYMLLTSYLDELEKTGGILTLQKGTYRISNTLYLASNVTVKLEDGVKIEKIFQTGNATFPPAQTLFMTIPHSVSQMKNVAKGYNGTKKIRIIGEGNATIDLKYIKDAHGICIAHAQDVEIRNVNFRNMNGGHFMEIDASKNVTVKNCSFKGVSKECPFNKEAINIDTPDETTGGLNVVWSVPDKTPDYNLVIENCVFQNLKRGIGTHKYSWSSSSDCAHNKISLNNNTFSKIENEAVFMMNWKNIRVVNNQFSKCGYAFGFRGVKKSFTLRNNIFKNSSLMAGDVVFAYDYCNNGSGSQYPGIKNDFGATTLEELMRMNDSKN